MRKRTRAISSAVGLVIERNTCHLRLSAVEAIDEFKSVLFRRFQSKSCSQKTRLTSDTVSSQTAHKLKPAVHL